MLIFSLDWARSMLPVRRLNASIRVSLTRRSSDRNLHTKRHPCFSTSITLCLYLSRVRSFEISMGHWQYTEARYKCTIVRILLRYINAIKISLSFRIIFTLSVNVHCLGSSDLFRIVVLSCDSFYRKTIQMRLLDQHTLYTHAQLK